MSPQIGLFALPALHISTGYFLFHGLAPGRRRDESVAGSLVCAMTLPSSACFILAGFLQRFLTETFVLTVSAGLLAASLLVWKVRPLAAGTSRAQVREESSVPILLVSLGAAIVFFALYDAFEFHLMCVHYPMAYSLGLPLGAEPATSNRILWLPLEQRLGTPAMVAPWVAAAGYGGVRLFSALTFATIAAGAYVLGARIFTGRPRLGGMASAGLFVLNPILTSIKDLDQNVVAMAVLIGLALAMSSRPLPAVLTGLLAGALFAVEHLWILAIGALVARVWWEDPPRRRPAAAGVAIGLFSFTAFFALHHQLAFGGLLTYEGFQAIRSPVEHHLFGLIPYRVTALWNFPLDSSIVRSPFHAFPTFILFPLWVIQGFGTIVVGASVVGLLSAVRRREHASLLWILGIAPVALCLLVQENWSELLKLRLGIEVLPGVLVAALFGCQRIWARRWLKGLAILGLSTGAVTLAALAATRLRAPVDERAYRQMPSIPRENALILEKITEEQSRVPLVPIQAIASDFFPVRVAHGIGPALREMSLPRFKDHSETLVQLLPRYLDPERFHRIFDPGPIWKRPEAPADAGAPVVPLSVDLSRCPIDPIQTIRAGQDSGGDLRVDMGEALKEPILFTDLSLLWIDRPVDILATVAGEGVRKEATLVVIVRGEPAGAVPLKKIRGAEVMVPAGSEFILIVLLHKNPTIGIVFAASREEDGSLRIFGPKRI